MIPLDIFQAVRQNKTIQELNQLEAWLTFFSTDKPEDIIGLIERFPEFKPMYEDVYNLCQNIEKVMGMYSKELLELDRNTVQYMIERMQKELEDKTTQLEEKDAALNEKDAEIARLKAFLNKS